MVTNQVIGEAKPYYFGEADAPLYGCFHPAQASVRGYAVVLASPLGDEAIRIHRAYRQLALRLSQAGFPTLRFDYFGSGDSAGEDVEATLQRWQDDLALAIEEVKKQSGLDRVVLMGLRLGGVLSLRAASQRQDVHGVVLWEPVTSGSDYIQSLIEAHETRLNYFFTEPDTDGVPSDILELLGFSLSAAMRAEIEGLNLFEVTPPDRLVGVLLVERAATDVAARLKAHLEGQAVRVVYQCLDDPSVWGEDPDKALIPGQTLKAIMNWMNENF